MCAEVEENVDHQACNAIFKAVGQSVLWQACG